MLSNNFPEQNLILHHRTTGVEKKITLRPFREGDEDGVISCIESEYEDTYFKWEFYDKKILPKLQ